MNRSLLYCFIISCSSYSMDDIKHKITPRTIESNTPHYLDKPFFASLENAGETHQIIVAADGPYTRRTGKYRSTLSISNDQLTIACQFQPSSGSKLIAETVIELTDLSSVVNAHLVDHHTHHMPHGLEFQWFAAHARMIKKYSWHPFKKSHDQEVLDATVATLPFSPNYLGYNHHEKILLAAREDTELCAAILINCTTWKQYELTQWQPHYHQLLKKLEQEKVQVQKDFFSAIEWNITQQPHKQTKLDESASSSLH